jgi:hypothetical protein
MRNGSAHDCWFGGNSRMTERECHHEATVTITAGMEYLRSIVAPCRYCGAVQEFPVSRPGDIPVASVRHLRLAPPRRWFEGNSMNAATEVRFERIAEVMRLIAEDCEADALALDGKPFNGRTMAEQFGNILAAVKSLAEAVAASTGGFGAAYGLKPRSRLQRRRPRTTNERARIDAPVP